VVSADTEDYYEHLDLVKSTKDYEAYEDRFPKFLPSTNLQQKRLPFQRYRASLLSLRKGRRVKYLFMAVGCRPKTKVS